MASAKGGSDGIARELAKFSRKFDKGDSNGPVVKVGFLSGANYDDGTPVALVAAINEFGAPSRGQPPRPFFRNMIAEHGKTWSKELADVLAHHDMDGELALRDLGSIIADQLRDSINDLTEPALAESTKAAKGFDKPLVDTGFMWNSVDFAVKE